jgi:hypothetical protein
VGEGRKKRALSRVEFFFFFFFGFLMSGEMFEVGGRDEGGMVA